MQCCTEPGCPELTESGPCQKHRRAQEATRRLTQDKRYGLQRWRVYSAKRLALHPFCALCGLLADLTDHIKPVRTHPHLFWDPTNHQSLCTVCNQTKRFEDAKTEPEYGDEPPRQWTIA